MGIRKQDLILCGAIRRGPRSDGGSQSASPSGTPLAPSVNAAALLCLRQDGDSIPLHRSTRRPGSHLA